MFHLTGFNPAAFCILPMLIALNFSVPAFSQDTGERAGRDAIIARNVHYEVRESASEEGRKCLYRDERQLLCPGTAFITFEKHYKTRDYDLIVISMGELGSGTRWWDWKLIIENAKQAVIKPLADECLECDIQVKRLDFRSNDVDFTYRQKKRQISAGFHAGQITVHKSKLDAREPIDENTCDVIFGVYEECQSTDRNSARCTMDRGTAIHFTLYRAEDRYAGFSLERLEQLCKAACSSGKQMSRTTFFKKVCRR